MFNIVLKSLPTPRRALDFLLPPRCPMCRARIVEHGHLCGACWRGLTPIADPKCARCALPFSFESDSEICGSCIQTPPIFDGASAPVHYDEKGRELVLALKYGGLFAVVPAMARMMATQFLPRATDGRAYDYIIPVPLHRRRLLQRRFNQSQLLAAEMGKLLNAPLNVHALKRSRATPSQGTLGRHKRFANVKAAFTIPPKQQEALSGKSILLVDDVLTTGATASACATTLKAAGASYVHVAAFARAGEAVPA